MCLVHNNFQQIMYLFCVISKEIIKCYIIIYLLKFHKLPFPSSLYIIQHFNNNIPVNINHANLCKICLTSLSIILSIYTSSPFTSHRKLLSPLYILAAITAFLPLNDTITFASSTIP